MAYYRVDKNIYLSSLQLKDVNQLVELLKDKEIHKNILEIPFPYTQEDGKNFVNICKKNTRKYGVIINWAIRDHNKKLIGVCSFHKKYSSRSKKDEIGYWLGRTYWNKGIMTIVVKKLCEIGFNKFNLKELKHKYSPTTLLHAKCLKKSDSSSKEHYVNR